MAVRTLHRLGKQEIARRELDTAIRLFFEEADPVSILVLASASGAISRDVCKAKGIAKSMGDILEGGRSPDEVKAIRRQWNTAYNHFKHAKDDPSTYVTFHEQLNDAVILRAIFDYQMAFGERTRPMNVFWAWFSVRDARLLNLKREEERQLIVDAFGFIRGKSRKVQKRAAYLSLKISELASQRRSARSARDLKRTIHDLRALMSRRDLRALISSRL